MNQMQSKRTTVRRGPSRATYDRNEIFAVLEAEYICHVGFQDQGTPLVIPMFYAVDGEYLVLHGSIASRLIQKLKAEEASISVTILDGLVLARSAFHHSLNYRSVVMVGQFESVEDGASKIRLSGLLVEKVAKGRHGHTRMPNAAELKQTAFLRLKVSEASMKARLGPPSDDDDDYQLPYWAGVVPIQRTYGAAIPDPELPKETPLPQHVLDLYAKD